MRIEPTAEDLALAMKLHARGVLEQYQRSDNRDAQVIVDLEDLKLETAISNRIAQDEREAP